MRCSATGSPLLTDLEGPIVRSESPRQCAWAKRALVGGRLSRCRSRGCLQGCPLVRHRRTDYCVLRQIREHPIASGVSLRIQVHSDHRFRFIPITQDHAIREPARASRSPSQAMLSSDQKPRAVVGHGQFVVLGDMVSDGISESGWVDDGTMIRVEGSVIAMTERRAPDRKRLTVTHSVQCQR